MVRFLVVAKPSIVACAVIRVSSVVLVGFCHVPSLEECIHFALEGHSFRWLLSFAVGPTFSPPNAQERIGSLGGQPSRTGIRSPHCSVEWFRVGSRSFVSLAFQPPALACPWIVR